jgi:hypothetical protein
MKSIDCVGAALKGTLNRKFVGAATELGQSKHQLDLNNGPQTHVLIVPLKAMARQPCASFNGSVVHI